MYVCVYVCVLYTHVFKFVCAHVCMCMCVYVCVCDFCYYNLKKKTIYFSFKIIGIIFQDRIQFIYQRTGFLCVVN